MRTRQGTVEARDTLAYRLLKACAHDRCRRDAAAIARQLADLHHHGRRAVRLLDMLARFVDYRGKDVLEIGCGTGDLSIALAKAGAKRVIGVDIDRGRIEAATRKAGEEGVASIVSFHAADFVHDCMPMSPVDLVFSENAFEHILSPSECLGKVYACLRAGGVLATRFGPLWLSPYGAHAWEFTRLPWVHLLFPERVVLRVRAELYRPDDPATRYEDVQGHLNRMTVSRFTALASARGFRIAALRANPSLDAGPLKWVNGLVNAVPPLRELGAHVLLAVLEKPAPGTCAPRGVART